jgi:hypothetical protein
MAKTAEETLNSLITGLRKQLERVGAAEASRQTGIGQPAVWRWLTEGGNLSIVSLRRLLRVDWSKIPDKARQGRPRTTPVKNPVRKKKSAGKASSVDS